MNFFSYMRVELNRIFHSRRVYLIILLTMISPIVGFNLNENMFQTIYAQTISSDLIAKPCITTALTGGGLFALLTLIEFDRVQKHQTGALMNSIVSPLVLNVVRLFALGIAAIITVTLTALMYFPYIAMKMGNSFDAYTYLNSFFLFMLPSILLSILLASAFYQIFYRMDLSMVVFITFMLLSCSVILGFLNILCWINPPIPALSDDFSNAMVFRLMGHNRLFWFLMAGGIWLMALLCVRRYSKGICGSFLHNSKKFYILLTAVVLISGGCYAYINQPYIDRTKFSYMFKMKEMQNNKQLELSNTDLEISFDTYKGRLLGKAVYLLQNLSGSSQECTFSINQGYNISCITANTKEVEFKSLNNNKNNIVFTMPNDKKIKLIIEYSGAPKVPQVLSSMLLSTNISDKYIDLNGVDLCPRLRVEDSKAGSKITGQFTMPAKFTPAVTGQKVKMLSQKGTNKTWIAQDNGNSFNLIAGDYVMKEFNSKGIPIEFYYSRKHDAVMEKMSAEKVMKDTITYCTAHYGKLYNVSENCPLKILQGTVFYLGGRAYTNLSIMEETCFSDRNLNNELNGASKAEVIAHEIAHQWWNNETVKEDPNHNAWTAEGLTVYTTYRVAKQIYGKEYAEKNYVDNWKKRVKEQKSNFYNRHPEYLSILPEKYVDKIHGINRSTETYNKIPLQILKASELVGGEDNMDKILAKLYNNVPKTRQRTTEFVLSYEEHQKNMKVNKTIKWKDFLDACGVKEEELKIE